MFALVSSLENRYPNNIFFVYIYADLLRCKRLFFCSLQLIRIPIRNDPSGIRISIINIRIYYDLSKEKGKKKGLKCLFLRPFVIFVVTFSGAAGSRTLVQTKNSFALYMFRSWARNNEPNDHAWHAYTPVVPAANPFQPVIFWTSNYITLIQSLY